MIRLAEEEEEEVEEEGSGVGDDGRAGENEVLPLLFVAALAYLLDEHLLLTSQSGRRCPTRCLSVLRLRLLLLLLPFVDCLASFQGNGSLAAKPALR